MNVQIGVFRTPRSSLLLHLAFGSILMALLPGDLHADLWYEHYERGLDAIKSQHWDKAVRELQKAYEQRRTPGSSVRTYGMNFISYYPYLQLGIAYFNLGQFDAALKAFDTETSFGAIARSDSDMQNLQTFRRLAQERGREALQSEQDRIARIVSDSLDRARTLADENRLDEAIAALGPATAVDSENEGVRRMLRDLRTRVARRETARLENEAFDTFVTRGREHLAAERFQEASAALTQALALRPDESVQKLLDESQAQLRKRLDAEKDAATRREVAAKGLEKVAGLEQAGRHAEALEALQSVLAVEPQNTEALSLQSRLRESQARAGRETIALEQVARLLQDGEDLLRRGLDQQAVVSLNRVIALDPANSKALGLIGQAYTQLNRSLIGRVATRIPPVLALLNPTTHDGAGRPLPQERAVVDGQDLPAPYEERVRSPDFTLSGSVFDDTPTPIEVRFLVRTSPDGPERELLKETIDSVEAMGAFYRYAISRTLTLTPGPRFIRVVVTDADGLSAEKIHQVRYVPPVYRKSWFLPAAVLLVGLPVAGSQVARLRRRNRMRKRRFNPYIAGAPVLDDQLFVGRDALLSRILETIHNNSILLFGERRIGKTSLQHQLRKRLQALQDPEYEFHSVYIDLQGTPEDRFFRTMAEDLLAEFGALLKEDGVPTQLSEGGLYDDRAFARDLKAVLAALRKRTPKRVKLVLLIDEVDELNAYNPRINQKLRSLFMKSFAEDLVAVVSGVGIQKHWDIEGSPWYNFFEEIEVKPFARRDAERLIEEPIRGLFHLDKEAVGRIIENTDCKPYLIQKLCIALVNRMHDARRRRITVADVDAVGRPAE